jgi:hypothetical protein
MPPGGFIPSPAAYPVPSGQPGGSNGLAIGGLVCGIIGLLTFWICGLGALLGVVAVILSAIGLNSAKKRSDGSGRGMAIGGLITGGLAILASIAFVVFFFVIADSTTSELENLDSNEFFPELNSDPADGVCDSDRFIQDPDC